MTSTILLTNVEAQDNDVLAITGYINGERVTATGWQSALTNHYDPSSYDADGNRVAAAKPRSMTGQEARAYCEQLLVEAANVTSPPAAPGLQTVLTAIRVDSEPPPA